MFAELLVLCFFMPFVVLRCLKIQTSIFEVVYLLLTLVFLSCITMLPDVENYQSMYEYQYTDGELGFLSLIQFFYERGVGFYQFYMLCHTFVLMLIYLSVKMMSFNFLKCMTLYLLYPFLLDVIQIRNAIFMALFLLAFAICARCKHIIVEYAVWIFFIMLACSQHSSAYAYLPAVLFWNKKRWMEKVPFIMFFLTSFLILIDGSSLMVVMQKIFVIADVAGTRYDGYMEKRSSLGGFLMMFKSVLMIYVVWLSKKFFFVCNLVLENHSSSVVPTGKVVERTYGLLLFSTFFWPLYVVSATFGRLMQNMMLLVYIVYFLFCNAYVCLRKELENDLLNDYFVKISVPFVVLVMVNAEWIWVEYYEEIVVCLVRNLQWLFVFR